MEQRKLKVEPAGNTEGDWWAATPSSTELPEYIPGEFDQLLKHGAEGGEAPVDPAPQEIVGDSESEEHPGEGEVVEEVDQLTLLEMHMNALLQAGGKEGRAQRARRFVERFTPKFSGR